MKKGKSGQASVIVSVILLVLILVIVVTALVIILMNPNFINFQEKEETPTIIIKTIQETPAQPVCNYPYRQIGNTCCIDNDYNFICDSDEIKKQYTPSCSYPYMRDGSNCCLDDDDNDVCDMYEYHYVRYHHDRYNRRGCHRYYDSNRSRWYDDCDY